MEIVNGIKISVVERNEIKEMIRKLNASGVLKEAIHYVGRKPQNLANSFCSAIEEFEDDEETLKKIPEEVIRYYNMIVADESELAEYQEKKKEDERESGGASEGKKAGEKEKAKKKKAPAKKKAPPKKKAPAKKKAPPKKKAKPKEKAQTKPETKPETGQKGPKSGRGGQKDQKGKGKAAPKKKKASEAPKKGSGSRKAPPKKKAPAKKKTKKEGTPTRRDYRPRKPKMVKNPLRPKREAKRLLPESNKHIVYKTWKASVNAGEPLSPVALWEQTINKQVKLHTVRNWVSDWRRGENFPAGVLD
jgi:hypothetical protein